MVGDCLEGFLQFRPGQSGTFGLVVRCMSDGTKGIPILIHTKSGTVTVGGKQIETAVGNESVHSFHWYLDNSVLEVFADGGRICTAAVIPLDWGGSLNVALVAEEGDMTVERLDLWPLKPVW
jgi:hypothetical protein